MRKLKFREITCWNWAAICAQIVKTIWHLDKWIIDLCFVDVCVWICSYFFWGKKKAPGVSLAQCVTGNVITWKRTGLWAVWFVMNPFIHVTCVWLSCCYFPCPLPILGFILFILIQREKERQEGETSLIRSTVKNEAGERRAMITPALREALTKQGETPQELL